MAAPVRPRRRMALIRTNKPSLVFEAVQDGEMIRTSSPYIAIEIGPGDMIELPDADGQGKITVRVCEFQTERVAGSIGDITVIRTSPA